MKLGKKIAGLAVGGALLAGSIAGVAFAGSDTQCSPEQRREQFYQEFVSDFAANLGVSEDKVTAALEATKKQIVQEAVQQGRLTQDQADKILSKKGPGFGFGRFGFGKGGRLHGRQGIVQNTEFLDSAAGVLGMTAEELKSELQSGKRLGQVVDEHGMTMKEFRQKMPKPQRPVSD